MDPIHLPLSLFAAADTADLKKQIETLQETLRQSTVRDSLLATVGLIAAAASIIVCLVNRLTRTGTVARENVRLMHQLNRCCRLKANEPDSPEAWIDCARMESMAEQNQTLLRRYSTIQLILAFLCCAVLAQTIYVGYIFWQNIVNVEPFAGFTATIGLGFIFLGALFGYWEWLHSVDALSHEIAYGRWLAEGAAVNKMPKFSRRVLIRFILRKNK